jgi:hypothetical protein
MQPQRNTPNLRETEDLTIQSGAIAILRIGEGVVAILALEPGVS